MYTLYGMNECMKCGFLKIKTKIALVNVINPVTFICLTL